MRPRSWEDRTRDVAALADTAATLRSSLGPYRRERPRPADEAALLRQVGCPDRLIGPISSRTGQRGSSKVPGSLAGRGRLLDLARARRDEVYAIAARHHVRRVRVFGSAARGEDGPGSDLDLLVDVDSNRFTLLDLAALRRELSAVLGVRVDVVTVSTLREGARPAAVAEAVTL